MPENSTPDEQAPRAQGGEPAAASEPDDATTTPDDTQTPTETENGDADQHDSAAAAPTAPRETVTTYESTPQGHRVIRRTVHREEITEETKETITETFPITYPGLYQPPTSGSEPAPVG